MTAFKNAYAKIQPGYGHYTFFTTYYSKEYCITSTDSQAYDDWNDDNERRVNRGKKAIHAAVVAYAKRMIAAR